MFGMHKFRRGGAVRLGPIGARPDLHRLGEGAQDILDITPPLARDWGQYQTFWAGNFTPGTGFNSDQYTYGNMTIRAQTPALITNQLHGGAMSQQVGAVTISDLLDRMRAAWASTQG